MLSKLHNIHVGVSLVALTTEGALECTCVTPKGTSYEWMSLYDWDWPAYKIQLPPKSQLQIIKDKTSDAILQQADIENTELKSLFLGCISEDERDGVRLSTFFSELPQFSSLENEIVFVMFYDGVVHFYKDYASLEAAFSEHWGVTPWEECSDDVMEDILCRIDNFDEIPLISFSEEGEE